MNKRCINIIIKLSWRAYILYPCSFTWLYKWLVKEQSIMKKKTLKISLEILKGIKIIYFNKDKYIFFMCIGFNNNIFQIWRKTEKLSFLLINGLSNLSIYIIINIMFLINDVVSSTDNLFLLFIYCLISTSNSPSFIL